MGKTSHTRIKNTNTRPTLKQLTDTMHQMHTVEHQLERLYNTKRLSNSPKIKALEDKLTILDDIVANATDHTWDQYLASTNSIMEEV